MINKITNQPLQFSPNQLQVGKGTPAEAQQKFATFLKDSINNVSKLQHESDIATNKMANGQRIELHEVMIASQKASITMQATIEIRNKVVEAYQEVMRMQV